MSADLAILYWPRPDDLYMLRTLGDSYKNNSSQHTGLLRASMAIPSPCHGSRSVIIGRQLRVMRNAVNTTTVLNTSVLA